MAQLSHSCSFLLAPVQLQQSTPTPSLLVGSTHQPQQHGRAILGLVSHWQADQPAAWARKWREGKPAAILSWETSPP